MASSQQEMIDRALSRAVESYRRIRENKKARSIKIIEPPKVSHERSKPSGSKKQHICQAFLMTGTQCKYKATSSCGRFCGKHNIK